MWEIRGYASEKDWIEAICAHVDDPMRVQQMVEEEMYWKRKRDRRYITIVNEDLL